ncbi:serine hydrolase domain-containing protein, partial [Acidobacteriota bacterium]
FIFVSSFEGRTQSREDFLGKGQYQGKYWPTENWRECRPEEVGMDSIKLVKIYDYVADAGKATKGIVIIRKGYIVGESYFMNTNQHSQYESYSMAKSVMSAIIGIALDQNILESVNKEIYHYFPELVQKKAIGIRGNIQEGGHSTDDIASLDVLPATKKRLITIRDVLQMRSGLEWNEPLDQGLFASDVAQMILRDDYLQYVLTKPLTHEPGTHWRYSSGDSMLLSGLIDRASGRTAYAFGYDNLFLPIGMPDIRWEGDPSGHTIGGWGIEATVRDYAKFGYLYQKKGRWDDRQIVSEAWVDESTQPISGETDHYGYQWWLLPALGGHEESDVPEDTFYALGLFNQNIFVIPSEEIVIVRTAEGVLSTNWSALEFLNLVMDSLVN